MPLTLVVTRSDGVEYRRNVVPDQGIGERSLDVPIISSAPTGTWRVAAFTDPKWPAIGEATFLVEDYVADRLEFDLSTTATSISPAAPAKIEVDGRFLYGAPASGLTLDGEINIAKVTELPGFAGYVFGLDDDSDANQDDESDTFPSPICRRPTAQAKRASPRRSARCRPRPGRSRPRSWCAWRRLAAARSSAS